MEPYAVTLLYCGLALIALAWMWLIVGAFEVKFLWGMSSLLVPPIALVFASRHAQKAMNPLIVLVLGGFIAATPVGYSLAGPHDLALRAKFHEGPKLWTVARASLESDAAHQWIEARAFYMLGGGVAVAGLGWIWLVVRAFRQGRGWGFGSLVVPPLGLVFAGRYRHRGMIPLIWCLLGLVVASTPAVFTTFVPLDLGPLETTIDGQRHLTLSGWDRRDYSILKLKADTVVLQMANPDVTDEILQSVVAMKGLQELDLSGTQVTDGGLKVLNDLPALSTLRLSRTKITDQGFQDTLLTKNSLMQLDLSGTHVSRESVQAWRKAKAGRRAMQ